jgi:allantoinase
MIRGGAMGFKAFMIDSGIGEFGAVSADDLRAALPVIRDLNVPLLVHAEDGSSAPSSTSPTSSSSRSNSSYASWLASRPAAMELDAVRTVIGLLKVRRDGDGGGDGGGDGDGVC